MVKNNSVQTWRCRRIHFSPLQSHSNWEYPSEDEVPGEKIKTQGNLSSEYSNAVTPPNIKHLLAFVSKLKDYLSVPSQEALWFLLQIDTQSRTLSSSPQAWASLSTQREPGLGWPLRL